MTEQLDQLCSPLQRRQSPFVGGGRGWFGWIEQWGWWALAAAAGGKRRCSVSLALDGAYLDRPTIAKFAALMRRLPHLTKERNPSLFAHLQSSPHTSVNSSALLPLITALGRLPASFTICHHGFPRLQGRPILWQTGRVCLQRAETQSLHHRRPRFQDYRCC